MRRSHRRPRLSAALVSLVAVLSVQVGVVTSSATASADPEITAVTPDVSGTTVTLAFAVDRFERSIGSAVCTLTDAAQEVTTVSCGTSAEGPGKKMTTYSTTLSGLDEGDHVFGVTVTTAHGGRSATASVPFSIAVVPPADAAAACAALDGGTFVADLYWWQLWNCDFTATSMEQVAAETPVFEQFCVLQGGTFHTGGAAPGTYSFSCWTF